MRIVIAEGQSFARHAMRTLIEEEGHEVIAEVDDGLDALHRTLELGPDLLIVPMRLPRLGGIEVVQRLTQHGSTVRTLIFSSFDSPHFVEMAMQVRATGFVSKHDDIGQLRHALRALHAGRTYFPALPPRGPQAAQSEREQIASLSPREMTVLRYLADGYGNRAIADELLLSDRTVSTYKARLLHKLNVRSVVELAEILKRFENAKAGDVAPATRTAADLAPDSLHTVLDAIPAGITIRDRNGKLLFINAFLAQRYRDLEADPWHDPFGEVRGVSPEALAEVMEVYSDAVQRGATFRHDVVLTVQGEHKAITYWGAPLRLNGAQIDAMVCGIYAIGSEEHDFAALRDANERASAASRDHATLLADLERRLAAPVERISAAFQRIAESGQALDGTVIADAKQASDELAAWLTSVRNWAAANPSPSLVRRERAKLRQLTEDVFAEHTRGKPAGQCELTVNGPAGTPAVWIDRDRYRHTVAGLFNHATIAGRNGQFQAALRQRIRPRGLIEAELSVGWETESSAEPPLLPVWQSLAGRLSASLRFSHEQHHAQLLLVFTLARATATG
jgi:DNA-binding NarL/FixJ family response regulator